MREKYETLKLADLRDIVKNLKVKGYSTMSKDELIDILVEKEKEVASKAKENVQESAEEPVKASSKEAEQKNVKENDASGQKKDKKTSVEKAHKKSKNESVKKKENSEVSEKNEEKNSETAEPAEEKKEEKPINVQVNQAPEMEYDPKLDSHNTVHGIVEVLSDGYGFIRSDNYLSGENDVYLSHGQIRKYGLRTGDVIVGNTKVKSEKEKFSALLYVTKINNKSPEEIAKRYKFEEMTPIFPNEKIKLDIPNCPISMRIVDLVSPVGKGQRGMIVSQPKAGKTTLLKDIAKSILYNRQNMHMIILLIDERPEEVTDIKEAIKGDNVEVIYSTFDETPEHHKKVSEMVIERARRLVESKEDVIILLDSITRLTRAYNQVIPPSGRTLSGGLDPAALHMPKKFFGAARNMKEGGSLTILATALVDTGSKMDDVVFEEFKGTGNMELVLDRKLSEKRVFPAIDIPKSGTRNEHLLLNEDELNAVNYMRRGFNGLKPEETVDKVLDLFSKTRNNEEFVSMMNKIKWY